MITPQDSTVPIMSPYVQASTVDDLRPPIPNEIDPDNPPGSPLLNLVAAFLTWIGSVALLLLPQLIALPYLLSHYKGTKPTIEALMADKTFILIVVSGLIPAHILTLLLALAVVTKMGRLPAKQVLGWSWPKNFGPLKSTGVAVGLFGVALLLIWRFGGAETELQKMLESSRAAALVTAVVAATTAPLVEEIIYRGVLYPALQRVIGMIPAIVIVTIMFAAPHVPQYWPNLGVISAISVLSLVLTTVRARTGRLLPCIAIHFVFNGIQSVMIVVEPYIKTLILHWQQRPANGLIHILTGLLS